MRRPSRSVWSRFSLAFALATFWAVEAAAAAGTLAGDDHRQRRHARPGGFDAVTGQWGYAPSHITVSKGTMVTFSNPPTNKRPHTVTDIARPGGPFEGSLNAVPGSIRHPPRRPTSLSGTPGRSTRPTWTRATIATTAASTPGWWPASRPGS